MSNRVDLIVKNSSLECICQEDKSLEVNTKVLEEGHFKVAKEMKKSKSLPRLASPRLNSRLIF
jgi:hypothetical protein